jgi:Rrf2 family protein
VAQRQDISQRYLEQILPLLAPGRLLQTQRGATGGYRLAPDPAKVRVGDVIRLTEGDLCPVSCLEEEAQECPRKGFCATRPVWQGLGRIINEYLDGITLADLLKAQEGAEPAAS